MRYVLICSELDFIDLCTRLHSIRFHTRILRYFPISSVLVFVDIWAVQPMAYGRYSLMLWLDLKCWWKKRNLARSGMTLADGMTLAVSMTLRWAVCTANCLWSVFFFISISNLNLLVSQSLYLNLQSQSPERSKRDLEKYIIDWN